MTRPPLGLNVEVTSSQGGRFRWGANELPENRPQNLSFSTKIGEGFSNASLTLPRRIDLDYPDLTLVNDAAFIGADGTVAYEGRLSAMPRELADSHSISVTLAGWMAHAKDRKFQEIYIDRDLGGWGPVSRGRRASLLAGNFVPYDPSTGIDQGSSLAAVQTEIQGSWGAPYLPVADAFYDAGSGLTIGRIAYSWQVRGAGTSAPWQWFVILSPTDTAAAGTQDSGNLVGAGPGTGTLTSTGSFRYALLSLRYSSTPAGVDGAVYAIDWTKLAVYGAHGLPTFVGETGEPPGVYASDVLRDIVTRWCPKLNSRGVTDTTYVIQHLEFKDRGFPYDAFLEINKFHLWHLGVWENRTLFFRPYDLSTAKWEVRYDEPGVSVSLQGDSVDDFFNGVAVTYTDLLTGVRAVLTPDVYADLADIDPNNPWNQQGIDHWDELELSSPTLQAQALQIGRARLAEANRPKAPGTINVTGYVHDRSGSLEPAWKVRAGDTIAITNYPNDRPRLIHETSWNDTDGTLTITVEGPAPTLPALFDRLANALGARGLS